MGKTLSRMDQQQEFFVEASDGYVQLLVAEVARAEGASSVVPDLRGVTFVCGGNLARQIVRKAGKLAPALDSLCLRALTHVLEASGHTPTQWVAEALGGAMEEEAAGHVRSFSLETRTDDVDADGR